MTTTREDTVEKTLRWMSENLNGAYTAVHPQDHRYAGKHCTNSGTCVLVCCYINALGKVLLRGGPPRGKPRRDFVRFREFLAFCMNDFLTESRIRSLPNTPRGNCGGDEWLYEVYRCGFVHGFYPGADVAWGRARDYKKYWFMKNGRLVLNIDELVRGFERGLVEFRQLVDADADLRSRFKEYIVAG